MPVLNNWWQTETGSAITATCLGYGNNINPPKYTCGLPFVGYDIKVLHPDGTEVEPNELGRIVVKLPLPPGNMSTLYKNDELFVKTYFQRYPVKRRKHLSLLIEGQIVRKSLNFRATTTQWTPATKTPTAMCL